MPVKIVDGELICPFCGGNYLHQTVTTVFERDEDADSCARTVVENGRTEVTPAASNTGNPSSRRHGLTLCFTCEFGGGADHPDIPIVLCVAQHKGNTLIFWEHEGYF